MSIEVSVVIPTYNRAHSLRRTLDALEQQDFGRDRFEVIVVDDGSTDGATPDVLQQPRPYPLITLQQSNTGPAGARNAALTRATGSIAVFIDDDVIPAPDLLSRHAAAQADGPAVVMGAMLPPAAEHGHSIWASWESRMLQKQYDDMLAGRWVPTPRQFYTANASVPREALFDAGLFDPTFRRAEDVELAYRIEDRGLPFRFLPEARVTHDTPRTLHAWMNMAAAYGTADIRMWREKGRRQILSNIAGEFAASRNGLLRFAARVVVGRRPLVRGLRFGTPPLIGACTIFRMRRAGHAVCSATFNLLYWDAASAEIGGRSTFWRSMRDFRDPAATPVIATVTDAALSEGQ